MESQQIHASDEEQGTIEEELNIDNNILLEETDNIKHTMTQSRFKNPLEKALMNHLNLKDSTKRTYDNPENPLTVERAKEGI